MGQLWFQAIQALGVSAFKNPDPGRFAGLRQVDRFSTKTATPWELSPDNLARYDSGVLAVFRSTDYNGRHRDTLLIDGDLHAYTNDADKTWTSTLTFDTTPAPAGYDVHEIRTSAGLPVAANGDERSHQAYELWWSSVDAPDTFMPLGDFRHIIVNTAQRASQIALTRPGGAPIATRLFRLQFRFKPPPTRQFGFIGIDSPVHYREIEVLGQASAN